MPKLCILDKEVENIFIVDTTKDNKVCVKINPDGSSECTNGYKIIVNYKKIDKPE